MISRQLLLDPNANGIIPSSVHLTNASENHCFNSFGLNGLTIQLFSHSIYDIYFLTHSFPFFCYVKSKFLLSLVTSQQSGVITTKMVICSGSPTLCLLVHSDRLMFICLSMSASHICHCQPLVVYLPYMFPSSMGWETP